MKHTTWSSAFAFYIIKIKSLIYMQEIIQYIIVAAVIIVAIVYVVYRVRWRSEAAVRDVTAVADAL